MLIPLFIGDRLVRRSPNALVSAPASWMKRLDDEILWKLELRSINADTRALMKLRRQLEQAMALEGSRSFIQPIKTD